ncbi:hypothetical protein [Candidatus Mycoplasma mahonii]|uniref:hypothetical protein n=1 Tax=Candidatus Mycoplasma mahonii TaxID=3004105 RepID=UPI0026ED0CD3|nr:hypothetical protein [Candidatus Mycoplasma mahonii]WKX02465.1 hypothetical protein O3I44_00065 [Candidatus Mycoplasma mahonii]
MSNTKITKATLKSYIDTNQELIKNDLTTFKLFDLLTEVNKDTVRHDESKIKKCVEEIIK